MTAIFRNISPILVTSVLSRKESRRIFGNLRAISGNFSQNNFFIISKKTDIENVRFFYFCSNSFNMIVVFGSDGFLGERMVSKLQETGGVDSS